MDSKPQARGPPDPADRPASRPSFRFVSRGTPSQRQMLGKAPVLTPEPWHIRESPGAGQGAPHRPHTGLLWSSRQMAAPEPVAGRPVTALPPSLSAAPRDAPATPSSEIGRALQHFSPRFPDVEKASGSPLPAAAWLEPVRTDGQPAQLWPYRGPHALGPRPTSPDRGTSRTTARPISARQPRTEMWAAENLPARESPAPPESGARPAPQDIPRPHSPRPRPTSPVLPKDVLAAPAAPVARPPSAAAALESAAAGPARSSLRGSLPRRPLSGASATVISATELDAATERERTASARRRERQRQADRRTHAGRASPPPAHPAIERVPSPTATEQADLQEAFESGTGEVPRGSWRVGQPAIGQSHRRAPVIAAVAQRMRTGQEGKRVPSEGMIRPDSTDRALWEAYMVQKSRRLTNCLAAVLDRQNQSLSDMVTMIGAGATIDVAQGDPRKRRIAFGGDGAGAADDKNGSKLALTPAELVAAFNEGGHAFDALTERGMLPPYKFVRHATNRMEPLIWELQSALADRETVPDPFESTGPAGTSSEGPGEAGSPGRRQPQVSLCGGQPGTCKRFYATAGASAPVSPRPVGERVGRGPRRSSVASAAEEHWAGMSHTRGASASVWSRGYDSSAGEVLLMDVAGIVDPKSTNLRRGTSTTSWIDGYKFATERRRKMQKAMGRLSEEQRARLVRMLRRYLVRVRRARAGRQGSLDPSSSPPRPTFKPHRTVVVAGPQAGPPSGAAGEGAEVAKGDAKAEEPPAEAAGDGDKAMRDLQGILNDAVTGSQFMDVHFFSHKPRGGYMTGPVIEVEVGHMMQHHTRVVQALKQGLVVQRAARRFDTADGPEVVELAQRLKVDSGAEDFEKIRKRATIGSFQNQRERARANGDVVGLDIMEHMRKLGRMPIALSVTEDDIDGILAPDRLLLSSELLSGPPNGALAASPKPKPSSPHRRSSKAPSQNSMDKARSVQGKPSRKDSMLRTAAEATPGAPGSHPPAPAAGARTFRRRADIQKRRDAAMASPWAYEKMQRGKAPQVWDTAPMLGASSTRVKAADQIRSIGTRENRIKVAEAMRALKRHDDADQISDIRQLHRRLQSSFGAKALKMHLQRQGDPLPYFLRLSAPTDAQLVRGIHNDTGAGAGGMGLGRHEVGALQLSSSLVRTGVLGGVEAEWRR